MIKLPGPVGKLVSLKTPSHLLKIGMSCEENGPLKRIVADLSLDKEMLQTSSKKSDECQRCSGSLSMTFGRSGR